MAKLGCPTANIPITGLEVGGNKDVESGVYYGWAGLSLASSTTDASQAPNPTVPEGEGGARHEEAEQHTAAAATSENYKVYPMVMSIGWNPFYKNEMRTVEVHIIHKFDRDFYNALLNLSILGFIRQEQDYDSLDALVKDINIDIDVAKQSLVRSEYAKLSQDSYLGDFTWA